MSKYSVFAILFLKYYLGKYSHNIQLQRFAKLSSTFGQLINRNLGRLALRHTVPLNHAKFYELLNEISNLVLNTLYLLYYLVLPIILMQDFHSRNSHMVC